MDYVNLANNHILDFFEPGLRETLSRLDGAGIRHTGAGLSLEEASRSARLLVGNRSVGVFSFADHYEDWDAAKRGAGVFFVSVPPREDSWRRIERTVQELRKENDLVVASVHWGSNMRDAPSDDVVRLAHRLVDAGVGVIHGHSAHVFHGVEIRGGSVILYDTGDFLDDYAVDPVLRNDYSFLYVVRLSGGAIERVELVPVVIRDLRVDVARKGDRDKIFALFERRTRRFATPFRVDQDRILIPVGRSGD